MKPAVRPFGVLSARSFSDMTHARSRVGKARRANLMYMRAFVGRQVLLDVGGDEFFIDVLFYHLKLRCYVVIELKGGKFKPEHLGQLGFYLTAVDRQVKSEHDNPSIGLLLCKSKNKIVAEYALGDKSQPMGIAEYKLLESLPPELRTSLPSVEQIEHELAGDGASVEDGSQ
jgi:YhcG PDDEXK nuclease domain